ncbi:MAG: hypothetical protein BYD32DRAFT_463998 [Podila humilis]|nr:MAG: hypothetical protein BYD32DRAFT_463998 [Podila humilis]
MGASQTRSRSILARMTVYAVMSLAILSLSCSLKNSVAEAAPIPLDSFTLSSPSDKSISSPPLLKRSGSSPATDRMTLPQDRCTGINRSEIDSYSNALCNQSNYPNPRTSFSDSGNSSSGYNRENVPSSPYPSGNNGSSRSVQDNTRRD